MAMQAEESLSSGPDEDRAGRISELLHVHGEDQTRNRPEVAVWTPDSAAQEYILDLDHNPQAYLIGCQ